MHSNRMRVARAERQAKQFDLARRTGINQSRISLIERGYVEPTDSEKLKLARALKMPIEELFPEAVTK